MPLESSSDPDPFPLESSEPDPGPLEPPPPEPGPELSSPAFCGSQSGSSSCSGSSHLPGRSSSSPVVVCVVVPVSVVVGVETVSERAILFYETETTVGTAASDEAEAT